MGMAWRVLSQRSQDVLTPQGTFEPVWVITYTTIPDGVTGTITVPSRLYTEDYVREQIDLLAAINTAVQNL